MAVAQLIFGNRLGILWFELNVNVGVVVSDAVVDRQDVLIVDNGCHFRSWDRENYSQAGKGHIVSSNTLGVNETNQSCCVRISHLKETPHCLNENK